jgi:putative tricarboxylic transport membrane protein
MDVFLGVLLIALSLAVYALMYDFPSATVAEGMGPAFMPGILIFILIVLSIILIIDGLTQRKKKDRPSRTISSILGPNLKNPGILILIVSVYLLSLNSIGFLIATPAFILFTMITTGASLKPAIVMGICLTALVYVAFALALKVPLPAGHIPDLLGG